MCKMTENNKRRDDDFEQSSSSANALRNASSYWKHFKQQQNSGQEHRDGLTNKDQKVRDGFSTKMEVLCSNFFAPKTKSWDLYHVRLLRCGILPSSLRVLLLLLVSLAGLPLLASCFLFDISVVLLRIRGFCCLWFMFLLSFTCTLSSSQVSMHCTLSITVCTCTLCQ